MSDEGQRLDAERPWPGLAAYSEANREFFKGRDRQAEDLLRLVERETITWLYGRSGLGKTSLLQAGLFRPLRCAGYLPVPIRLALDEDAAGLHQQLAGALKREAAEHGVEAPKWDGSGSLWEYFYAKEGELWSADDRLVLPVLVFDQFEEIFTLGRETPERRRRVEAFLAELGEAAENRRPEELRRRLEEVPALAARFDHRRLPPKLLFSFREDYLADFDDLHEFLRGRSSNRLRLLPLAGGAAKEAILAAGADKLEPAVAEQIVRFIDARKKPLAQLEIEPALLSLVCQKLNEKRITSRKDRIDPGLLADGSATAILEEFYENAFEGLDKRVRRFVEDRLLTASGHRDTCALDNALAEPGIDNNALAKLTARRLLRREDRDNQVRFELIHDRLAPIVKESRDSRREVEKRRATRLRQRNFGLLLLAVAIFVGLFFLVTLFQARENSRQASLVLVDYAARAIDEGENERAARFAALAARKGLLDVAEPLAVPTLAAAAQASALVTEIRSPSHTNQRLQESPDGKLIVSWDPRDRFIVWDTHSGEELVHFQQESVLDAAFDIQGRRLLLRGRDGWAQVREVATGRVMAAWPGKVDGTRVRFDTTGDRMLSLGIDGNVRVWDTSTGEEISSIRHERKIIGAIFDDTGTRVLSWEEDGIVKLWNSSTGHVLATLRQKTGLYGAMFDSSGRKVLWLDLTDKVQVWEPSTGRDLISFQDGSPFWGAHFDNSGNRLVTWGEDKVARVWDISTGLILARSSFDAFIMGTTLGQGAERILTWDSGGLVRVWDASTGKTLSEIRHTNGFTSAKFSKDGSRVLSWGEDRKVVLWDSVSGKTIVSQHHPKRLYGAALVDEGRRIYSWDETGAVRFWQPQFIELDSADFVAVASESEHMLTGTKDTVRIWKSSTGAMVAEVQEPELRGATLDPAGLRCLTWSETAAHVWDTSKGTQIGSIQFKEAVRETKLDSKGERVASYSGRTVIVWNAISGQQVLLEHSATVSGIEFDPAGQRILTWDEAGKVRIWRADANDEPLILAPEGGVLTAIFDHRGQRVLTRGRSYVQVWDSDTGSRLGLARHENSSPEAVFDRSGAHVVSWTPRPAFYSGAEKGHLRVWRSDTAEVELQSMDASIVNAEFDATGRSLLLRAPASLTVMGVTGWRYQKFSSPNFEPDEAVFDRGGDRVIGWGRHGVRIWDTATGVELAAPTSQAVEMATLDYSGSRLIVRYQDGRVEIRDVSWTSPRSSSRILIDDVCRDKLRGPNIWLDRPFVNRIGQTITKDSVRRISQEDAEFAPIVRDRIGEDVCTPPTFYDRILRPIRRWIEN